VDRTARRNRVAASARTRRPAERRGEILDTALDLFAERGYHATGVADIAAELNMSHGTFYKYFDSKRDILDQTVDDAARRIAAALASAGPPRAARTLSDYRRQVEQIAQALTAASTEDPRIIRLLLLEATGVDEQMTCKLLGLLARLRQATATYLTNGIEAGYLRGDLEPEQTARAINALLYAGGLEIATGGMALEDYTEAAIQLVFDGIAA
jgi:AcrR family transcriptional regulator